MNALKHFLCVHTLVLILFLLGCGGQQTRETPPQAPSSSQKKIHSPAPPQEAEKPATPIEPLAPSENAAKEPIPDTAKMKESAAKPGTDVRSLKPAPPASKLKGPDPALLNPSLAKGKAPDLFRVKFETTKGNFILQVTRSWAPLGADRFYNLVKIGYFTDLAFFRIIEGFMAQFGISGDPKINEKWEPARIQDDPVKESNMRGMISFATAGPNTRTTQLFINYADNSKLDRMGFAPFGKVIEGITVVDNLYKNYGEGFPRGRGPAQDRIQSEGNRYLKSEFPNLDYIKQATLVN